MKHTIKNLIILAATAFVPLVALAQGTAFTYQGRLYDGTNPANGNYDLTFAPFKVSSGPGQVEATFTNTATAVSNGLFVVTLDFGAAAFDGADRWLGIGVRTNGVGSFTTLNPRQPITPTPYSITAGKVTGPVAAEQLSGQLSGPQIADGAVGAAKVNSAEVQLRVTGTAPAGQFITGIAANGSVSTAFDSGDWKLNGNGGTTPGPQFLGTTDNQPLEIKVNGQRALRVENNGDSISDADSIPDGAPSLIGGTVRNFISAGVVGATIAGGGATSFDGAAYTNFVMSDFGVVGGGLGNTIAGSSIAATIAGGKANQIGFSSTSSAIGGGENNSIGGGSVYAIIAGGLNNIIANGSAYSVIGGGEVNNIATGSGDATISGGASNEIGTNSHYSLISGGSDNTIAANSFAASVTGGESNDIGNDSRYSWVGGGAFNDILDDSEAASIAGGHSNDIGTNSHQSAIGGGYNNNIADNSSVANIAGGSSNDIGTNSSAGAIGGGSANKISDNSGNATITGGNFNSIGMNSSFSAIGGGSFNRITNNSRYTIIAGGNLNDIGSNSTSSVIGGGTDNNIAAGSTNATIAGGYSNDIGTNSYFTTIGGGRSNSIAANALAATIAGGLDNSIGNLGQISAIGGGLNNTISNSFQASIVGGRDNVISFASYSVIAGGRQNTIGTNSNYAFAAGHRAKANHTGAFVWGDSDESDVVSTANNQFTARASGGVRFFSNTGQSAGVSLAPGGTSWSVISDRNVKKDFAAVDARLILDKLAALPITQWHYEWEAVDVTPHIGPMAQDFKAAFYPGSDDKSITTQEADGVVLAAIQGLNQKVEEKDAEIRNLRGRLEKLERLLSRERNNGEGK